MGITKTSEKLFIELYNTGKSSYELAVIFKCGERTVQTYERRLRKQGKIKYRKDIIQKIQTKNILQVNNLSEKNLDEFIKKAKTQWKIEKPKKSKEKKPFKTYLVIADSHIPHHNQIAHKAVFGLMDDVKFDGFIVLGDFMSMDIISHWNKNKKKTLETKRMKEDYIDGNALLDELDKRLPKGCDKRYFFGNHECLDDKTELLTKERGWINYSDINTKKDRVLSFNYKTNKGEWVSIDKLIIKQFEGKLNKIDTNVINLKCTDDHKVFWKNRKNDKWNYSKIKDLNNNRIQIPINCSSMIQKEYLISDEMITLIGYILTDGHITKKQLGMGITQRKSNVNKILKVLDKLDFKYTKTTYDRDIKQICGVSLLSQEPSCNVYIKKEARNEILKYISKDKSIPDWTKKLSNRQFRIFLEALIEGDGSKHISCPDTSWMLYGKKEFLDKIQALCLVNGYGASISTYRQCQYRLNICPRSLYNLDNLKEKIIKENYKGKVWDLTVKNHNFMIRREGKAHFTGNCWYFDLIEELPVLEGYFNPTDELKLKERGYKVYEDMNHVERIGRLCFTHGVYATVNPVRKHIAEFKTNVIFGHTHKLGSRTETSPAKDIAIVGYNIPCMCDMNPDFMKNRPNSWTHGFAVVYFYENGFFDVDLKRIVKGKFIFNNKLYNGNK